MSAIAAITVFDGAATPVSHTLSPISVTRTGEKVVALWRELTAGVPTYAQVRMQASIERLKSGVYRTEFQTVVPVMESISGQNAAGYTAAPKVAYENTINEIGFFHERSTVTDRRLARQMAVNVSGSVATSVAPVTTGPFPELFDLLMAPT
jgi:hypothetical protein